MPLKVRTKRLLIVAVAVFTCLLMGGLAFVFYFMHAVYETENPLAATDVPEAVRASFAKQFPTAAEVMWEIEDGLFEAEFVWQGQDNVEAHYSPDGTWKKTVSPIRFSALPEKAQSYLKSQDGYEIMEEERIELPDSPPTYEAKLANKLIEWNCLFDVEGNLISKTRDGPVLE
jgi:hypothetical protein